MPKKIKVRVKMTIKKKTPPSYSVATPLMERTVCPLCSHFHPGGMRRTLTDKRCKCCRIDVERHGSSQP